MTTSIDLAPILALPVGERQAIVDLILDSMAADAATQTDELPEAFKAELRRRVAEHEADPSSAIPWEVVKAEILNRVER